MSASHGHEFHNSPPVPEHEQSYHHFVIALRYIVLALSVVVTDLLVWFGFGAGWLAGVLVSVVILAVGLYFAYDRPPAEP